MTKNILIADDEPNILLSLEFLMKRAGYSVQKVSDGQAAIEAIEQNPPDLILLDVMMPKKTGYEVCQAIRDNIQWNNIKVVLLTARGRDVDQEKGFALGADDYITKPFAIQDVVEKVKELLG